MAFIPVPETIRATIVYENTDGDRATNTLYFHDNLGEPDVGRLGVLGGMIFAWAGSYWDALSTAYWEMVRVELSALDSEEAPYLAYPINVVGVTSDVPLPNEVTIAVSLRTAYGGRSRRGRLYHVGLHQNQLVDNLLVPAIASDIVDCYTQLLDSATTQDFSWYVVSFVEDGAPRVSGLTTPITTILLTDTIVDSMRTRKPKA